MKTCPVCNDSFADQLNFCDIDGARLSREGSVQERNKWWSLLGAGLLVGALVITAASIFFLPKARVSSPIVGSDSQASPTPPSAASAGGSSSAVASAPAVSAEPESVPAVAIVPEVKRKDKALANESVSGATPNPKAAALAAEGADKKPATIEAKEPAPPVPTRPEASSSAGSDDDSRSDSAAKPQPPSDLKKDTKNPPPNAKSSDKDSNDKKKNDDKDKKKGGFLRVFKKIFGKD